MFSNASVSTAFYDPFSKIDSITYFYPCFCKSFSKQITKINFINTNPVNSVNCSFYFRLLNKFIKLCRAVVIRILSKGEIANKYY